MMAGEYSKTLLSLEGSAEHQIEQLRGQLQRVQEETEDMLRDMSKQIKALQEQVEKLKEGKG